MPAIKQTTTSIEIEGTTVILDGATQVTGNIDVSAPGAVTLFASAGSNDITMGGSGSTVVMPGNLTVSGTTTFIDTTNLRVEDATIELNSDAAGSGVASNEDAGIDILSDTGGNTVTFRVTGSDGGYLESSSGLSVATGEAFYVNGVDTLNATTLGSAVVNSSLTSVGTISTGTWQGSVISTTYTAAKVVSVSGTSGTITAGGTAADPVLTIDAAYVGQTSITTLGTVATGTWQGTAIGSAYGGTGQDFSGSTGFIQFSTGTAAVIAQIDLTTDVTDVLPVANGGTGASSFANDAVVFTDPTGNLTSAPLVDGQVLIGATGTAPVPATLTAGSGIAISNAAGAVTITNTGGGFTDSGTYTSGTTATSTITVPSGTSAEVGFMAQVYLEDGSDSALVEISGLITRASGAALAPDFTLVVVPGADGGNVVLSATPTPNTLSIDITSPSGSGNYYTNVTFVQG